MRESVASGRVMEARRRTVSAMCESCQNDGSELFLSILTTSSSASQSLDSWLNRKPDDGWLIEGRENESRLYCLCMLTKLQFRKQHIIFVDGRDGFIHHIFNDIWQFSKDEFMKSIAFGRFYIGNGSSSASHDPWTDLSHSGKRCHLSGRFSSAHLFLINSEWNNASSQRKIINAAIETLRSQFLHFLLAVIFPVHYVVTLQSSHWSSSVNDGSYEGIIVSLHNYTLLQ